MKKIKSFFLALTLTLLFIPTIQSCLDDNDEYKLAIATFRLTESDDPYFVLDKGEKMHPQNGIYSKYEDGQRMYVYFDLLDEKVDGYDYNINVRGIQTILTKDVIPMTEETIDSIGDDKIDLDAMWIGDGYLNIQYKFMGTYAPAKRHMLNLVQNEIEGANEEEEEGYISLEFRHNAYEDYPYEVIDGIVSFKLPFDQKDVKGLKIRYNSILQEVKYKKIDFKSEDTSERTSFNQSIIPSTAPAN